MSHVESQYFQTVSLDHHGVPSLVTPKGFRIIIPTGLEPPREHNFGNYRRIRQGRVILGPKPHILGISFLCCVFLHLLLVAQTEEIEQLGVLTLLLGHILVLGTITTFLVVSLSDPGILPRDYRLQELIYDTETFRDQHPNSRFYWYCQQCQKFRPPRSHHCSLCNICIRDREFHFLLGGVCVGERTSRSSLIMSLFSNLTAIYLIVVNAILLWFQPKRASSSLKFGTEVASFVTGVSMLFLPQVGILIFVYKLYAIGTGQPLYYTLNKNNRLLYNFELDKKPVLINYRDYFLNARKKSSLDRRGKEIVPAMSFDDVVNIMNLPYGQELLDMHYELLGRFCRIDNRSGRLPCWNSSNVKSLALSFMNEQKLKRKSHLRIVPSLPHLNHEEIQKLRKGSIKYRGAAGNQACLLQGLSKHIQVAATQPGLLRRPTVKEAPTTMSQGALHRPGGISTQEIVAAAKATQFRRLLELVLLRDKPGIMHMHRSVNLNSLLGVINFDPENIQFVELTNGLPMLAPRRRDNNLRQNRFTGLISIPQLVASGLLPSARQIASQIEAYLGVGCIRRVPNAMHTHYIYQYISDSHHCQVNNGNSRDLNALQRLQNTRRQDIVLPFAAMRRFRDTVHYRIRNRRIEQHTHALAHYLADMEHSRRDRYENEEFRRILPGRINHSNQIAPNDAYSFSSRQRQDSNNNDNESSL